MSFKASSFAKITAVSGADMSMVNPCYLRLLQASRNFSSVSHDSGATTAYSVSVRLTRDKNAFRGTGVRTRDGATPWAFVSKLWRSCLTELTELPNTVALHAGLGSSVFFFSFHLLAWDSELEFYPTRWTQCAIWEAAARNLDGRASIQFQSFFFNNRNIGICTCK